MVERTLLNDTGGYLHSMISITFITPLLIIVKSSVQNYFYLKLFSFYNTDPKLHQILRDNQQPGLCEIL